MQKIIPLLLIVLTACSLQSAPAIESTVTFIPPVFATATLFPTFTPRPTATIAPPTIAPTAEPVLGSLTSQVNVRSAPDQRARSLGLLNFGARVQVIGKDESGKWWQIVYPENSKSTAWVSSQYVQVKDEDAQTIPITSSSAPQQPEILNLTATPPSPAESPTDRPHSARVTAQINVRSGPGQSFSSLGLINAGTEVILTGRNQNNMWIRIQYESGDNKNGWVASAYLEGKDLTGLPYFDNQGVQLSEGSLSNPGQVTATPTTFSPAPADGDSEKTPITTMKFSPEGSREFSFSGDLSSPNGDGIDWVSFTPYEPTNQSTLVYVKLSCAGNGGITATLEQNGLEVPNAQQIVCGNYDVGMKVLGGKEYQLVLKADGSGGPLRYVQYTLVITTQP